MVEVRLHPTPILGTDTTRGQTRVRARNDLRLWSFALPQGAEPAVAAALKDDFGLDWPSPVQSSGSTPVRALLTQPDQVLLILEDPADPAIPDLGPAYRTDLSDGHVVLEIEGPDVDAALERLSPIDVSLHAFPEGAYARTLMEHVPVTTLRTGHDRFLLVAARSYAASVEHAVLASLDNVLAT
ncbi:MAG: sarcosine oxidase subunit gamma family protein [Pseudomonadota bacterium]